MHVLLHLLSVCVCVCWCVCQHLNAGDINIDPWQPLKLASKTVLIQHTPLKAQPQRSLTFPHTPAFPGIFPHLFIPSPMGFILHTTLPCSFTLLKDSSVSKYLLLGPRLLLIFVV